MLPGISICGDSASEPWECAKMIQTQVLRAELLEAMKGCLHDLEELKLFSPDDLDIIDERRILRQRIAELEGEN
jgi:hypothetical protein